MKKVKIALVRGDGAGPEMMAVAYKIAIEAAKRDDIEIEFVETPMGWNAYRKYGDTLPKESLRIVKELGILFFGGVGDPQYDNTIGKEHPEMMPEARTLLTIRKELGLLLNFRPMIFYKALASLAGVREERIPEQGIQQHYVRFLLEDEYFGNRDFMSEIDPEFCETFGIKSKEKVFGDESMITDLAYYKRETVEKYFRAAFRYARQVGLRVICVDKANVLSRYVFWRKICQRIHEEEFADVPLLFQYVDSANALLFTPVKLHGVIVCGNAHGDILSDGAAEAMGSLGMMCSSAINPDTGAAMFESGAGTAPTLAGQDKANPIGRILTAAMMLRHIGAINGANTIEEAVNRVLRAGWRTADLASSSDDSKMILGTKAMGEKVFMAM
jgi:3-isopropylmalate dehydrogenase